nr:MAG TPA: Putative oxidoreductase [Caudoviricetes sp.]
MRDRPDITPASRPWKSSGAPFTPPDPGGSDPQAAIAFCLSCKRPVCTPGCKELKEVLHKCPRKRGGGKTLEK